MAALEELTSWIDAYRLQAEQRYRRLDAVSTVEQRDTMVASGMEHGLRDSMQRLEEVLAR
ncbi:MAG TPA: hypothetical protein VN779_25250 [Actinocrinis sp.]|nr:hypothetical protein [Actinocrinis sp.]HXR74119.1 hypothetical protein [Actinocrinis sp.]